MGGILRHDFQEKLKAITLHAGGLASPPVFSGMMGGDEVCLQISEEEVRHRALRDVMLFGLFGGLLITLLKLTEYRFLVVEHSVGIYGALVAALSSGLGIRLGVTLARKTTLRPTPPHLQLASRRVVEPAR